MDDIDRELKEKESQDRALHDRIGEYQAKVDVVPKHESEMVELTRDYTTLQNTYSGLLAKREESKIAANLERRNIGEQFKVVDPARVPEHPFLPNRPLISLTGAAGGLAIGVLLIGLLDTAIPAWRVRRMSPRSFRCRCWRWSRSWAPARSAAS